MHDGFEMFSCIWCSIKSLCLKTGLNGKLCKRSQHTKFSSVFNKYEFLCPKGALSVCFVRPSVILSFRGRHSVIPSHQSLSSQLLLHPCMDLNETWYRCRIACGEIIHVWQILAELWPLTLRIYTHFSLSSQLLLHPCMDLNETWQGCCTTCLDVHVGR